MIPEWLSFRNEFCSRVIKWWNRTTPSKASLLAGFLCQIRNTINPEGSSISVYMIPEWNLVPERRFHSDWIPEWLVWGTKCRFGYHVNTNREIYGDEMDSFQTVCHSGMWIARLKEQRNKGMSPAGFWAMWKKQSNYSLLRNHSLSRHVLNETQKKADSVPLSKYWRKIDAIRWSKNLPGAK